MNDIMIPHQFKILASEALSRIPEISLPKCLSILRCQRFTYGKHSYTFSQLVCQNTPFYATIIFVSPILACTSNSRAQPQRPQNWQNADTNEFQFTPHHMRRFWRCLCGKWWWLPTDSHTCTRTQMRLAKHMSLEGQQEFTTQHLRRKQWSGVKRIGDAEKQKDMHKWLSTSRICIWMRTLTFKYIFHAWWLSIILQMCTVPVAKPAALCCLLFLHTIRFQK